MRIRHFAVGFAWATALILAVPAIPSASAAPAQKESWIGAWGFAVVPPPPGIAMTYLHQGKQYLVCAQGSNYGAELVAYCLPES